MYDKRLDAVLKAAELGSFSKAAQALGYTTPALIKKVDGFERQTGIIVFERTNKGVSLTPSGKLLLDEARQIVEQCRKAIETARQAQSQADNLVRVGVSLYQSGQRILTICQKMFLQGTDLAIQFVPVADTYESYKYTVGNLGKEVDVLASSLLPPEDERLCKRAILGNPFLCLEVPLNDELAAKDAIDISELSGRRIYVPQPGNTYIDSARAEIAEGARDVEFVEFPNYTIGVFDACVMSGSILLSKEIWRGVHPLLKTLSVRWDKTIPYCLYYAENASPAVLRFVEAAQRLSGD